MENFRRNSVEDYDYLFKIICAGDENCGQTPTAIQFSQGFYQEQYKLTLGSEFAVKTIKLFNGKKVKLQIWDTGAQEKFQHSRRILNTFYRGAMGAIIFFDISDRDSFEHVPKWIEEIRSNAGDIPILIVGNILEYENERKVSIMEGEDLALESLCYYIESCLHDVTLINDIFYTISCMMIGIDVPDKYLSYRRNMPDEQIQELKEKRKVADAYIRDINDPGGVQPDYLIEFKKNEEISKKIKKLINVSGKIRLDIMRDVLKMEFSEFNERLFDWAVEFGFKIDGDYIIIENSDVEGFINQLDKQFELWENRKK